MRIISHLWFFLFVVFLLQACASSTVERSVANQVDEGYQNTVGFFNHAGQSDPSSLYENATQTQRGVIIGGITGATVGGISSLGAVPGVIGGAIIGGALGQYIERRTTLVDKIRNRGVPVIVLGDQVLVVLRSAQIFKGMSAQIHPDANSTLNLVADLIRGYTKMTVKVSGYTDDLGSQMTNLALSRDQAEAIGRYLWLAGVDTRLLYAEGYGGTNLVQPTNIDWGAGSNYRIEITLQQLPV